MSLRSAILWWSGGITSAVACHLALKKYPKKFCRIIMLDTKNEHEDTYRFLKDCEKWYGLPIEQISSSDYSGVEDTWFRHKSLNTANGAVCSYMLKRRVREKWEKENFYLWQVFGFEYNKKEMNRAKALKLNHPHTRPRFPLIEAKMDKKECMELVEAQGIRLPEAYHMGFHNNNCLKTGCVQGGIGYWQKIQKERPDLFHRMAGIEHKLTEAKGIPVTMLKDQSKKAKELGRELVFLIKHPKYPHLKELKDMKGRPVKPLMECSGFCGTNELDVRNPTEDEINAPQPNYT